MPTFASLQDHDRRPGASTTASESPRIQDVGRWDKDQQGRPEAPPRPMPGLHYSLSLSSPPPLLHGSVRRARGGEGAEMGGDQDHRIEIGEMVDSAVGREEMKEEDASQTQREREAVTPRSSRRWRGPEVKTLEWTVEELRASSSSSSSSFSSSSTAARLWGLPLAAATKAAAALSSSRRRSSSISSSSKRSSKKWHLENERKGVELLDVEEGGLPPPRARVKQRVEGRKALLRGIAGKTQSGEFTAIMGPSGSGKTSLLHCLSLRLRRFKGAIKLDGESPGASYFTTAALVQQNEMMFGFMTVREHLDYHAMARMGGKHSKEEARERVTEVLEEVGLTKAAATVIGGEHPLFAAKGISGGERKRLNIATELLICPSIILLDEPTSGLDAVIADSVVTSLRDLASNRGVMVLASIHSPSSDAARCFSNLLLLTPDGRQAYFGPMKQAIPYFFSLGHPLPPACNPCDFFLELVSPAPFSPSSFPPSTPPSSRTQSPNAGTAATCYSSSYTTSSSFSSSSSPPSTRFIASSLPFFPLSQEAGSADATGRMEGGREGGKEGANDCLISSATAPIPPSPTPSNLPSSSSTTSSATSSPASPRRRRIMGREREEEEGRKERGRAGSLYRGLLQPAEGGMGREHDAREDEDIGEDGGDAADWPAHLERLVVAYRTSSLATLHASLLPSDTAHTRCQGVTRGQGADAVTLTKLNLWRGRLQAQRDFAGCFGILMVMFGGVGLLIGGIYAGQATTHWRDLVGMLFAASVTLLFNAAIAHMVRFPLEGAVILREYTSGANAIGPYIAAKFLSDIPYILGPICFSCGIYWTAGLVSDWATFGSFTAVAILVAQASMSMGVALACFSLDPSIGLTLLPVLTAPMVMFSGVLYERASVPSSLSWMSSFSIINHGFALMLSLEAPALPPGEPAIALAFAGIDNSPEALRGHFLALVLILAASYVITYLGLTVRARYFISI